MNASPASASLEWALLLACARVDEAPEPSILEAQGAGVDWARFFELAAQHGLAAPVAKRLDPSVAGLVPPTWLERFRQQHRAHGRRNLAAARTLVRLLRQFRRHGIQAVPFKGPALAQLAYQDLAARQFGDLDIWVRPEDFPGARQVLQELGYRTSGRVYGSEMSFGRPDGWIVVDLHWSPTVPRLAPLLDEAQMWNNLACIPVAGQPVATLSAEDMLLVVCVHGLKDSWRKLKTVRDVAALAGRPGIQWPALLERCQGQGSLRTLLIGLALAQDLLETPLPEPVQAQMAQDAAVQGWATALAQRLPAGPVQAAPPLLAAWDEARLHLTALTRASHRLRYTARRTGTLLTPNERDQALLGLPAWLAWLHYPLRPLRLIWEYGLPGLRSIWAR